MSKSGLAKKLEKIRESHDSLKEDKPLYNEHETFFGDGDSLITLLEGESYYDRKTKDTFLNYIDKIFNELYHIEVEGDEQFKEAFQAVITDNVQRFEQQNIYLQQWVDLASASDTIEGDIERALRNAIAELVGLQKDVASGGNLGRLYQKANRTYDHLFELRKQLKKYSHAHYHEKGQRNESSQFKPW